MSRENVMAFYEHLQGDEELQSLLMGELDTHGEISMGTILDTADEIGFGFDFDELYDVAFDQVGGELSDTSLDAVVGGTTAIKKIWDWNRFLEHKDYTTS